MRAPNHRLRFLPFVLVSLFLLAGCPNFSTTESSSSSTTAMVYLLNLTGSDTPQILGFPSTSTGTVSPTVTISGAANMQFSGLSVDSSGDLYTVGAPLAGYPGTIEEFSASASGASTPTRSITNSGLVLSGSLVVDKSGNVYAAGTNGLLEFSSSASGSSSPAVTLGSVGASALATDLNGNIYAAVSNGSTATVDVFTAGYSSSSSPSRTVYSGANPLASISGLAVDASGNLYVAGADSGGNQQVQVFASGASGNVTPTRVLKGSNTGFSQLYALAVDENATLYVQDSTSQNSVVKVHTFSSSANGNVAPTSTFTASGIGQGTPGLIVK